jgi:transcriptional regulator with XRE-family HTH domain
MDLTRKKYRLPIARRMAALRAEHGRTQVECATALGLAQPTYAEMESGVGRIRRRDLVTLAHLYGIPPEDAFPAFFGSAAEVSA